MQIYVPVDCESIDETAKNMVGRANESKLPIKANFNGVDIVVEHGDSIDATVRRYKNEYQRRRESGDSSLRMKLP